MYDDQRSFVLGESNAHGVKRSRDFISGQDKEIDLALQASNIAKEEENALMAMQSDLKKGKKKVEFEEKVTVIPFVNPITKADIDLENDCYGNTYLMNWAFNYQKPIYSGDKNSADVEKVGSSFMVDIEDQKRQNQLFYNKGLKKKAKFREENNKLQFASFVKNYQSLNHQPYPGTIETWLSGYYEKNAKDLFTKLSNERNHRLHEVGKWYLKAANMLARSSKKDLPIYSAKRVELLNSSFKAFFRTVERSNSYFHRSMDYCLRVIKSLQDINQHDLVIQYSKKLNCLFLFRLEQVEGNILDPRLHIKTKGLCSLKHIGKDCVSCAVYKNRLQQYYDASKK